ncbi:cilia- and flagella-associated protein 70 isoform X2 [Triplophysa dalaica]|uniref:cilia- and flagella-associated protein 70 isoform X2 n=1 Tax=Triplophysa dalaica TaxID=1582913 RepID=UPI0024DFEA3A|nr:cilia- and flagella-associated protein 70 isoform X2 [Triplophysa dalaica]
MESHRELERAVTVQITVLTGKHLRGSRSDSCLSFIRVEFNGCVLGDSQKLDVAANRDAVYNFTCSFECSEVAHTRDDLAHKPVILTVIEDSPEEKEQKTAVLGQAVVDLLPLLKGQRSVSSSVLLHAVPGSPLDVSQEEDREKATLDVSVSVQEPLLSDIQISESNMLMVTVETAYSVPDIWDPASTPLSSYMAALQIPLTAAKEQTLLFSNGRAKMGGERESVPRPKKWPVGHLLVPGAEVMEGQFIETEPTDMSHGDLTDIEDSDFKANAECNRNRVSWDTVRRCFIDAGGLACLSRRIAECRLWPIEIMRCPQTKPTDAGKNTKEKQARNIVEDEILFHGVVYVDLAPLLYPGVRRIHGTYRIHPFLESELLAKAQRTHSILKEMSRAPSAHGPTRPSSSVDTSKASQVFENKRENRDAFKKLVSQGKTDQTDSLADMKVQVNAEGQMCADSRSYIVIEIVLEKPLVPKRERPPGDLAKRLMPQRAERAVHHYHSQIASVTAQVLDQYRQLFGAAFAPGRPPLDPALREQRKARLLGELNSSGTYFAFKEQIKYSVVRIVREKMMRTDAFKDPEELQAFLSQLYVYLVDEMHVALNKTLSVDSQDEHHEPGLSCSQLKLLAKEAELNNDYQQAAQYYQECVVRDDSEPSHWFDYGVFHMLTADHIKAEECFQRAVSIDQKHTSSLLMCGVLSEMNGRYEDAEAFFESATCVEPDSVVAWTLFGLFCQSQEKSIQAEMTFLEANKHLRSVLKNKPKATSEPGEKNHQTDKTRTSPAGKTEETDGRSVNEDDKRDCKEEAEISPSKVKITIYTEAVRFLLQNYALQMAQRALAQQLLSPDRGSNSSYHLALAQLQLLRGEHNSAEESLREALTHNLQDPDVWALWGHLNYMREDYSQAKSCYERTLDSLDAVDTHSVLLRLGSIYLQDGEYKKAKGTFQRACRSSPSCLTWLRLGTAHYRMDELKEAEDALTKASALNSRNAEVYGFLTLVYLRAGRKPEAEQSYQYAVKMNLQKEFLLQEIHDLQARAGFEKRFL